MQARQDEVDFWSNQEEVTKVNKEIRSLERTLEKLDKYQNELNDIEVYLQLINEDDSLFGECESKIKTLNEELEKTKLLCLLSGAYDDMPAILTIHAGAGGTEAQDWADMLWRMYSMYAELEGYKIEVLDEQAGDVAGIKSITFRLEGDYAYGYLKAEKGVHRLVRISPFDSNARRHTSFASVEVIPELEEVDDIVIRPEDIRIDTFRSSGAGGQHVNKTDSAIRITHYATGIVVTCQNERSQVQNKEKAMNMLKAKLKILKEEEEQAKLNNIQGVLKKIEWGSQIRSYVFCPYTMVKDHRSNFETSDVEGVMNGKLQPFIEDYLQKANIKEE